jgi:hypothetical protein
VAPEEKGTGGAECVCVSAVGEGICLAEVVIMCESNSPIDLA